MPRLTLKERRQWQDGIFYKSYEKLGAHPTRRGTRFGLWAPHADTVTVLGDFNGWDPQAHPLTPGEAGLWEAFIPEARPGHHYKYHIRRGNYQVDKTDPYAFSMEPPHPDGNPIIGLSTLITDLSYPWQDDIWMSQRLGPESLDRPVSIYEVHLGSWRHTAEGKPLGYRGIAEPLADYVEKMGFTHVELMPVAEHPYYGSWGYQVVGYYAPTYRYGSPTDLMYLVDYLHQRGIGVLMDWVPAHFAVDPQGLVFFDGATLYEYDDPTMRTHPDWGTYVFDYGKPGVRNFLLSNALFWLDKYHIDGLRVDAVASMLYRDYSRSQWTPNRHGGNENLEAIDFFKQTNEAVYHFFPSAMTIAEESTAFPKVSAPTYDGGLGFLYKWNMGWMHDTLKYTQKEAIYRSYHFDELTFSFHYAFSEHYILPFSHDEVVHGKGPLWDKMPGDSWQKAANLRLLFGHMFAHPGKKLLFMGDEFGQTREWHHERALDWHLLDNPTHEGLSRWLQAINTLYRTHPALWNDTATGFRWIAGYKDENILCFERKDESHSLLFLLNFTPTPRHHFRLGVPTAGTYLERLNSDDSLYGGSGVTNAQPIKAVKFMSHFFPFSVELTLPPLGMVVLERKTRTPRKASKSTRKP